MSTTPTEILETTLAALETTAATATAAATDATGATESALDIQSIKDMMDAFDPAALLPELSDVFGSLTTVCRFAVMIGPVILLILDLDVLELVSEIVLGIAVILTVVSLVDYIVKNHKVLTEGSM